MNNSEACGPVFRSHIQLTHDSVRTAVAARLKGTFVSMSEMHLGIKGEISLRFGIIAD